MAFKLGSGERFARLKTALAKRRGIKNPAALAAAIGRRKYGAAKFQRLSVAARKRKKG